MRPANQALESKLLVSKGNLIILAFRHLLRLSIALCKARILGVRNLPLTRLIALITPSALVILYLHIPFFF
ncbi:MAG: hypothetical protein EOP34_06865 [Rickettsiales bacterium]|nr:MAG: hypothetical protein EOP34_06865 [Rickettsiales bacterium]